MDVASGLHVNQKSIDDNDDDDVDDMTSQKLLMSVKTSKDH